MPRVFIPPLLRPLADGAESIVVPGKTVSEVIDAIEGAFPESAGISVTAIRCGRGFRS